MLPDGEWHAPDLPARVQLAAGARGRHRHRPHGFLHLGARRADERARRHAGLLRAGRPRAALRGGRHGLRHHVRRLPAGRGRTAHYWRIAQLPVPVLRDDPDRRARARGARARLGADGRRAHAGASRSSAARSRSAGRAGGARSLDRHASTLPNTTDWYGRFRCAANAGQRLPDRPRGAAHERAATRASTASTSRIRPSPRAWAPIYDRTQEHLGSSDAMVIRTRQRLIDAAQGAARPRQGPARRRRSRGLPRALGRRRPAARRRLGRGHARAAPGRSSSTRAQPRSVLGGMPAV